VGYGDGSPAALLLLRSAPRERERDRSPLLSVCLQRELRIARCLNWCACAARLYPNTKQPCHPIASFPPLVFKKTDNFPNALSNQQWFVTSTTN
jgi:hypothetical protein